MTKTTGGVLVAGCDMDPATLGQCSTARRSEVCLRECSHHRMPAFHFLTSVADTSAAARRKVSPYAVQS